jgi:hypothetical protein
MSKNVSTVPRRGLALAPDVRACVADGQVILLHLRLNRYMGIGGTGAPLLAECLAKRHADAQVAAWERLEASGDGLAQRLLGSGLLIELDTANGSVSSGSEACDISEVSEEATTSLDLGDLAMRGPVTMRSVNRFLRSAATAAWWLRRRSLQSIAETLAVLRTRAPAKTEDLERMKHCAATYDLLRPLLLTARDRCLFDSLALTHFLATEQQFAKWIIGVKTSPFGAHSWVQYGSTVLNDQHEYVRRFSPILVA